jgi:hypothetical protein
MGNLKLTLVVTPTSIPSASTASTQLQTVQIALPIAASTARTAIGRASTAAPVA